MGKGQPSGTCTPMRLITYELIGEQEHRLERKFAVAEIEEVFKGRAKEIDNHRIVVTFGTEPPDERDADAASKRLVDLRLVLELGMFGLDGFKFDGDLFTGNDVDSEVDIAYCCRGVSG